MAPAPAGAVRVVHGEGVGLRVEHPVFQGEHIVFREQKIEIPVPRGPGGKQNTARQHFGEQAPPLGTNLRGHCDHGPVAKGAGRSEIPNPLGGLVPGKELWMPRRALRLGAVPPG